MKIIFSDNSSKELIKWRKHASKKKYEIAGPIFGYFDYIDGDMAICVTHLINKSKNSTYATVDFDFKTYPSAVKKFNNDSDFKTKYIGSWHTHPNCDCEPSPTDKDTFAVIHKQLKIDKTFFMIIGKDMHSEIIMSKSNNNKGYTVEYKEKKW